MKYVANPVVVDAFKIIELGTIGSDGQAVKLETDDPIFDRWEYATTEMTARMTPESWRLLGHPVRRLRVSESKRSVRAQIQATRTTRGEETVKDATGQFVEFGDVVHVKVGNEWIYGHVVKVQEGGIAIAGVPKQGGQTPVTPDGLVIQIGVTFMEQPGSPHPGILKLAAPNQKEDLRKSPLLVGDA